MIPKKHLATVFVLFVVFAFSASAAPLCTAPGTTYETLVGYGAGGCQVGAFLFYNFETLAATATDNTGILNTFSPAQNAAFASGINVAFNLTNNTVLMVFTPSTQNFLSAQGSGPSGGGGANGTLDFRPVFSVDVSQLGPPGAGITAVSEGLTGRGTANSPTNGGARFESFDTANESIQPNTGGAAIPLSPTITTTFPTGPTGPAYNPAGCFYCGGGSNDLQSTVQVMGNSTSWTTAGNLPAGTLTVHKDILIQAGKDTNNFAALDSLTEGFQASGLNPTPEPGEMILMGSGLIGLAIVVRKRRQSGAKPKVGVRSKGTQTEEYWERS